MGRPTEAQTIAAYRDDLAALEQLVEFADARWRAWIALDEGHDHTARWRTIREAMAQARDRVRQALEFYDAMKGPHA